ncbi:MAG: class A beta-lactamase-related serine hydrolase, partial [Pedobacter sp.]
MKKIKELFLAILVSSVSISAYAQSKAAKVEQLMKQYHDYNMFDGAVLVAEQGKVIFKGAYGKANQEWGINNTTDTKFMIGSVSKPITATLVLIQVQKGLIDLDKKLADYLPEFKKYGHKITIRQMLSHSSGMPNYDIYSDFFPRISRQNYTREDYIKLFKDADLVFEPGTSYYYSSWAYYT